MNILLFMESLIGFMADSVWPAVSGILAIIPKLIYFIVSALLSAMDFFQVAFRKIAGLDPIMIDNEIVRGDAIYTIISDALFDSKYPAIRTAFWAIIILGIFMLFVTTLVAVLRVEYKPDKDKGNAKGPIVAGFFKALFSFAIVPIVCIFGMFLSNSLIQVIDSATTSASVQSLDEFQYFGVWTNPEGLDNNILKESKSSHIAFDVFGITIPTTAEPFSGTVFRACAYSANRFRKYGNEYLDQVKNSGNDLGIFGQNANITESDDAAQIIDTAFAINAKVLLSNSANQSLSASNISGDYYSDGWIAINGSLKNVTHFSKYNSEMVWFFYDLWSFNYVVAFVAIMIIAKLYFNFTLALMARIFKIAALFIFAPVPISFMPLDGGGALEKWRKYFLIEFIFIFAIVFCLNIISPVLSIFQDIQFFGAPVLDYIVRTLFIIAALTVVNDFTQAVQKILGSEKEVDGSALGDKIKGQAISGVKTTASLAKMPFSAMRGVGALALNAGRAVRSSRVAKAAKGDSAEAKDAYESAKTDVTTREGDVASAEADVRAERTRSLDSRRDSELAMARSSYDSMNSVKKKALASSFFKTDAGRAFVASHGGTEAAAKSAMLAGGPDITAADKDSFAKFIRDKEMLDNSWRTRGLNLRSKGATYYSELEELSRMNEAQRVEQGYQRDVAESAAEAAAKSRLSTAQTALSNAETVRDDAKSKYDEKKGEWDRLEKERRDDKKKKREERIKKGSEKLKLSLTTPFANLNPFRSDK